MRILYAIQGTGNGHMSRALDILPELFKRAQVDILVSGTESEIRLPHHIRFRLQGLSFVFGTKGGIDYWQTFQRNSFTRFIKEVRSLPVEQYDLVINDFEPVSAWSARKKRVPCYSLSHQAALLSHQVPKPFIEDPLGKLILRYYAPSDMAYGFHFKEYDKGITFPSIRSEIRDAQVSDEGFYLVYLPAYDDDYLIDIFSQMDETKWKIYSKRGTQTYSIGHVHVQPISKLGFAEDMARCSGLLCGAGFETPAEALFLGKKLMVIPMKGQYEQKLNAMALGQLGVAVIKVLDERQLSKVRTWLNQGEVVQLEYPEVGKKMVDEIIVGFIGREIA